MISVLMSTYRENANEVELAIESILNQTYDGELELIIVFDDPDNETLRSWAKDRYKHDQRVRLIENDQNLGLANSLNKAINQSAGEFIARMDADDISLPDRLQLQLDYLLENDLDLIGGKLIAIDENEQPLYEIPDLPHTPERVAIAIGWNNCLPHPTWFGKREVFELGYRAIPLCGKPLCEDYDLQVRAVLHGFRLGNINETVLRYRIKENSLSKSDIYVQYLFQKELTKEYRAGRTVNPDVVIPKIAPKRESAAAKKYAQAQDKFNDGVTRMSSGQPIHGIWLILSAVFSSSGFFDKTRRITLASLAGKLDRE